MPESRDSRRLRRRFNLFPAYRATGGRVTYVADDLREVRVELKLRWLTRNLVGTLFGGSLYGAVDPLYMVMLMRLLGRDYVVWDKAATIRFRRPGRGTLHATFRIDEGELDAIREAVAREGRDGPGVPGRPRRRRRRRVRGGGEDDLRGLARGTRGPQGRFPVRTGHGLCNKSVTIRPRRVPKGRVQGQTLAMSAPDRRLARKAVARRQLC